MTGPAPPATKPSAMLEVRRLGRMPYGEAHTIQEDLVSRRIADAVGDLLLFCEHEPVITLGRGASEEDAGEARRAGLPIVEVERGGEATYHGPGQLVGYPILQLGEGRRDLHRYLRDLEEVIIRALADVDIEGRRDVQGTGVWIGDLKVCSIGVAVRRWVSWHGFALNIHNEPPALEGFRPCGLDPAVMTRVADHAELPPTTLLFEVLVVKHFCEVFELELPPPPPLPPAPESCGGCALLPPADEGN